MQKIRDHFKKDRYAAMSGIELLDVAEGYAKARMAIEDRHLNGLDMVHGGAIFTLADLTFAAASNSHGTVAVSINASIWYVKAVRSGTLVAQAKQISLTPKLATYAVDITDETGETIASFEGMVYRKKEALPA